MSSAVYIILTILLNSSPVGGLPIPGLIGSQVCFVSSSIGIVDFLDALLMTLFVADLLLRVVVWFWTRVVLPPLEGEPRLIRWGEMGRLGLWLRLRREESWPSVVYCD